MRADNDVRRPQLTDRDKQLFGYLGICRYLSTEQVLRLFFPARDRASSQRRLLRLAGEWGSVRGARKGAAYANFDPPYLRRLFFRTYEGQRVEVWALTEIGYAVASKVLRSPLRIPAADVGAAFLEHSILLNDVFVAVVDPAALPCAKCGAMLEWCAPIGAARGGQFLLRCGASACRVPANGRLPAVAELAFRWIGSEGIRLPWRDYDRQAGAVRDRVIVPDAVVELPAQRSRFFLEFETGSQSVVAPGDKKPGATVAKLERYGDFLFGLADVSRKLTHYRTVYADNWNPTVVFVVLNDSRRNAIGTVIKDAAQKFGGLSAKAMLGPDVATMLRGFPLRAASPAKEATPATEKLRAGRLSVRAQFLLDVASCLRKVVAVPGASERDRAVLRVAEIYAERAALVPQVE